MQTQHIANADYSYAVHVTRDSGDSLNLSEIVAKSFPKYKHMWALYVSERRLLLMFVDLTLLNASLLAAWILSLFRGTFLPSLPSQSINFLVLTILWLFFSRAVDCYNLRKAASPFAALVSVLQAGSVTVGIYLATVSIAGFWPPESYHVRWTLIALCWLFACTLIGIWRLFYAFVFSQPAFRCSAIAVGDSKGIRFITEIIEENLESEYSMLCGCDFNSCTPLRLGTSYNSPQVIRASNLASLATLVNAQEIILATNGVLTNEIQRELIQCYEQGTRIITLPKLYEDVTGRVPLDHIRSHWPMIVVERQAMTRAFDIGKCLFDFLFSIVAIIFSLPIWIALAVAIYLDSPGSIFYCQERIGKNGCPFRMIKFRSMIPDAEKDNQAMWAEEHDCRVTRVGRIMRATHLDEIPQFINILLGDMSFVGPRPERAQFVRQLESQMPLYSLRHAVRPGLTGWAQVKYCYAKSFQDSRVKLEYDLYYVKRRSFYLDTLILFKTIGTVLTLKGT